MRNFCVFIGRATFACLLTAAFAQADIIAQYTAGTDPPSLDDYFGQSFTTPSGGPWDSITFNFYSNDPGTIPTANGTAFLLSTEYLGAPGDLSSSTPGFLAQSTGISGGIYVFYTSITIDPDTQYWIYENGTVNITGSTVSGGTPGEHAYISFSAGQDFYSLPPTISNFTVAGSAAATPEPAASTLAAIAFAGLALALVRRRRLAAS